jgi:hypothetical protein
VSFPRHRVEIEVAVYPDFLRSSPADKAGLSQDICTQPHAVVPPLDGTFPLFALYRNREAVLDASGKPTSEMFWQDQLLRASFAPAAAWSSPEQAGAAGRDHLTFRFWTQDRPSFIVGYDSMDVYTQTAVYTYGDWAPDHVDGRKSDWYELAVYFTIAVGTLTVAVWGFRKLKWSF